MDKRVVPRYFFLFISHLLCSTGCGVVVLFGTEHNLMGTSSVKPVIELV